MRGKNTSKAEIVNVSKDGLWMLVQGEEYFLPYRKHPWFERATVKELYNFQFLHGRLLHWPALNVDLALDSFRHPEKYPLIARSAKSSHRKAA
jgi:hypothetical protein